MTPSTVADSSTGAPSARCAGCGGDNPRGSRFCGHCGKTLVPDASAPGDGPVSRLKAAVAEAAAGQPFVASADQLRAASVPLRERVVVTEPSDVPNQAKIVADSGEVEAAAPAPGAVGSPIAEEIDARRARQLLDRALKLAEHGDLKSAVLACRQAVALTPRSASGFSMLGVLLERTGDIQHAIDAYQKVLEISPGSVLERESLQRLVDAASRRSASPFHFDDNELFGDTRAARSPEAGPASTPSPGVSQAGAPLQRAAPRREGLVDGMPSQTPGAKASAPPVAHPAHVASGPARSSAIASPSRAVHSAASHPPAGVVSPGVVRASGAPAITALAPPPLPRSVLAAPSPRGAGRGALLQALQLQPSFYFRGLPIAATAMLSLAVLMAARGNGGVPNATLQPAESNPAAAPRATTRAAAPRPNASANSAPATAGARLASAAPANGLAIAPNPAQGAGSGYPVSNSIVVQPRHTPYVPARRISAREARPSITHVGTNGVVQDVTESPLRPARVTGFIRSGRFNSGNAGSDGLPNMPPARIVLASPNQSFAPIRTLPVDPGFSDGSNSSLGGAPVNPGKSLTQGYIRVSPLKGDRAGAPPRASVLARNSERQASADAQAGRSDSALQHLSSAIQAGGSDTAYRYQQRAQLFFEKGDYARAADDFQTAISGYREQIARGDRVDLAKSGLQTCQTGMQLALANKP